MEDVVNLKCGQCGHINEIPADWAQPAAFCVKCGHKIPVPSPEQADDQFDDGADEQEVGFAEQARKSGGRKITVTCKQCGKTVTVSARVAGRKARCKGCDAPMNIPYPDDVEPAALPRPRNGAHEDGLELVGPGESDPDAAPDNEDRESMLDLLPEPIRDEVDDEGVHDTLPVVIPLTQQDAPSRSRPPHKREAEAEDAETTAEAEARTPPDQAGQESLAGLAESLQTEPPEEAGELASAVQDFKAGRSAVLARRRRAARIRSLIFLAVALVVLGGLAGGAVLLWPTLFPTSPELVDITDHPVRVTHTPPANPNPAESTPRKTTTVPAVASTNNNTTPKINPQPIQATCAPTNVVTSTFGPGGYYPAALGSTYWKMDIEVKAADKPVSFNAAGADVRLVAGDKTFNSLGVVNDSPSAALPRIARQEAVTVEPGKSRKLRLLFEVPIGFREGELVVGKVKSPFKIDPPQAAPLPATLAGTFVESAPRSLRPMLSDPVMAAIQSAGRQQLTIKPNDKGLAVAIPEAHVTGLAHQAAPGVYGVDLTDGSHKLAANLRFIEGGRTAILYLADKPFHQITYVSMSKPATPKPKPEPVKPKPEPVKPPEPKTPPTAATPPDTGTSRPGGTYTPPRNDPSGGKPDRLPTGRSIFD